MRRITWSRVAINLTVLALIVDLDGADARPVHHVVPGQGGDLQLRVVDRVHQSAGSVHARQLRAGALRRRRAGERLPEHARRDDPGSRHPDPHRGVRRVRVRLAEVPRPAAAVHHDRRPARRAPPDRPDPGPEGLPRDRPQRDLPRRSGWPMPASASPWRPTCSTTTSASSRRTSSSRRRSTARRTSRPSAGSSCPSRCRP